MKIDFAVQGTLENADIEQAIREYVEKRHPNVRVTEVVLDAKRQPARVECSFIGAHKDDSVPTPRVAEEEKSVEKDEPAKKTARTPKVNKNTEENLTKASKAMKRNTAKKQLVKDSDVEDQQDIPFDTDEEAVEDTQSETTPDTSIMDAAIAEADEEEQAEAMDKPEVTKQEEQVSKPPRKSLFGKK